MINAKEIDKRTFCKYCKCQSRWIIHRYISSDGALIYCLNCAQGHYFEKAIAFNLWLDLIVGKYNPLAKDLTTNTEL